MKLSQYLAFSLGISRRKACRIINESSITVNDSIVNSYSYIVTTSDIVKYNNELVSNTNTNNTDTANIQYKYYKFYKPRNIITSHATMQQFYRKINPELNNLKYAGRLDKESEGLLILTNDGHAINKLTHPSNKVTKYYTVKAKNYYDMGQIDELNRYNPQTCQVSVQSTDIQYNNVKLLFKLKEGKNRQIRNMCKSVGMHVTYLRRFRIGNLNLDNISSGEWQEITLEQLADSLN